MRKKPVDFPPSKKQRELFQTQRKRQPAPHNVKRPVDFSKSAVEAAAALPEASQPAAALSRSEMLQLKELVLFRHPKLLVLDKPAGMAVQGSAMSLASLMPTIDSLFPADTTTHKTKTKDDVQTHSATGAADDRQQPRLVHRIDRHTSGCLMIARNSDAARQITNRFHKGLVKKHYLAIVSGALPNHEGEISIPIEERRDGGVRVRGDLLTKGPLAFRFMAKASKPAVTRYRVLSSWTLRGRPMVSLVELEPTWHTLAVPSWATPSTALSTFCQRRYAAISA